MEIRQIETAQLHCNKTIKPFPWATYQWAQCWHSVGTCWHVTEYCVSQKHMRLPGQSMFMLMFLCTVTAICIEDSQVILWSESPRPSSGCRPREHTKSQNALRLTKGTETCNREHMNYCERINDNVSVTYTCIDLNPHSRKSWDILTCMNKRVW